MRTNAKGLEFEQLDFRDQFGIDPLPFHKYHLQSYIARDHVYDVAKLVVS